MHTIQKPIVSLKPLNDNFIMHVKNAIGPPKKRQNSPEVVGRKNTKSPLQNYNKFSNYRQKNVVTKYAYSTKIGIKS